jgi:hypothetical protein
MKQVDYKCFNLAEDAMPISLHRLSETTLLVVDSWKICEYNFIKSKYGQMMALPKHKGYRGSLILDNGYVAIYSSDFIHVWDFQERKRICILKCKKKREWRKVMSLNEFIICFDDTNEVMHVFCNYNFMVEYSLTSKAINVLILNDHKIVIVTDFDVCVFDLKMCKVVREWEPSEGEIISSAALPRERFAIVLRKSDRPLSIRKGDLLIFDMLEHPQDKPVRVRRNAMPGWVFNLKEKIEPIGQNPELSVE